MADNYTTNAGSGGSTFASDDVGAGLQVPRVKQQWGRDGTASDVGTLYRLIAAATNNAQSIKGSAGVVYAISVISTVATVRFLKLYNKASAPAPASDTPVLTLPIPASATGAGLVFPIPCGMDFNTGIALAIVANIGDTDNTSIAANDCVVHLVYV